MTTHLKRSVDALAWRLHRLLGDRIVYGTLLVCARLWRRLLTRPVYIAVAGSSGKTTAKELMLGMLGQQGICVGNVGSFNNIEEIAKAMLRLRPWHRAFVAEASEDRPGTVDRFVDLVRPQIGVITVVRDEHVAAFASSQQLSGEIGKLATAMHRNGVAILNADDARVMDFATLCQAKVLRYGTHAGADLRAEDVQSAWPARLSFVAVRGQERIFVQTRLCGAHWVTSALAAISACMAAGMSLQACAKGLARIEPHEGRMQPVETRGGVTFIRDDFKAALWSMPAALDFMKTAHAARKIIVIGEVSETNHRRERSYAEAALSALEVADTVVFVGPGATAALSASQPEAQGRLKAFGQVKDASAFVQSHARAGDLILLKGSNRQDHLVRIAMAATQGVDCWRDDCKRHIFCDACELRLKPSGARSAADLAQGVKPLQLDATASSAVQVLVGLGNPEPKYQDTPHNLGYRVLNHMADTMGVTWTETAHAVVASGLWRGQAVWLVKVRSR